MNKIIFSSLVWCGKYDPNKKIRERFRPIPKVERGFEDIGFDSWNDPSENGGRLTEGDGEERKKQAA